MAAAGSTLDITSNYSGDHAGRYIAAALNEAKSLEFMTMMENIKYKRNISQLDGGRHGDESGNLVQDRTCDFTAVGDLVMTEKILEPKALQINYQICKKDLIDDWQAQQMKAGQWNTAMGADFATFLLSRVAGIIAESTEAHIWGGAKATAGQFEGFMTNTTGLFNVDAVTSGGTAGTYTAANIVDKLAACVAAVPSAVYSKMSEDLYLYINPKTYRFYINAMSAKGYINAYSMNDTYVPFFEGIKIAVCPGMPDNNAVVAQASNLFFGTDLLSDSTEIRVLDMAPIDGSDNIRIVAKYTAAVQSGFAKDITWQK